MKITIELDVSVDREEEIRDIIEALAEDITDGDTAQEYYLTMVGWGYDKDHFRGVKEKAAKK